MEENNKFALGKIKYEGAIINPEKIPNKEDAEKYRQAVDDFFKALSVVMTVPRSYPDVAEKAYEEVFGKQKK